MTEVAWPDPRAHVVLMELITTSRDALALVSEHGTLLAFSPSWRADWADVTPLPLPRDVGHERVSVVDIDHRFKPPDDLLALPVTVERDDGIVRAHLLIARSPHSARAENRFLSLIESLPFAIGVHRDLRFSYVNPAACKFLGYDGPDELVDKPIVSIIPRPELAEVTGRVVRMMATGEPLEERTTTLLRKDGGVVSAELSAFPLVDFDGVTSYVVVARDVTEHRIYEARVQQAQRMEAVGRLAGGIAHDFNNILSVILSYADMLSTELPAGSHERDAASEIRGAALRAAEMTRRLLTFSRGQADGVGNHETVAIVAVLAQLMSLLRKMAGTEVAITIDAADPTISARILPTQLEQIVMNLVINARDALPHGGNIGISVRSDLKPPPGLGDSPFACISVKDDGVGMTEAVRLRAFEPFFSTKGPGLGTGMGLATVFGIARQAGGHVTLDSAPGRGTEVRVWLPIASSDAAEVPVPPQAAPRSPESAAVGRIVVVEDDPAVRLMMSRVLTRAGYELCESSSAEEALACVRNQADGFDRVPDLLITDVVMGETSGPQLALELRAMWPGLPVLFVSGYTDDMLGDEHTVGGRTVFVGKPFTPPELLANVAVLLPDARTRPR